MILGHLVEVKEGDKYYEEETEADACSVNLVGEKTVLESLRNTDDMLGRKDQEKRLEKALEFLKENPKVDKTSY